MMEKRVSKLSNNQELKKHTRFFSGTAIGGFSGPRPPPGQVPTNLGANLLQGLFPLSSFKDIISKTKNSLPGASKSFSCAPEGPERAGRKVQVIQGARAGLLDEMPKVC